MRYRAHVFFGGKVQGVFFRANTERKARETGIFGWVRNIPDGRVEAVFEGEKEDIEDVIDWCAHHQPYAAVENVEIRWEEPEGLKDFFIMR